MPPAIHALHAPDGFVSVPIAIVMWIATAAIVAYAVKRTNATLDERAVPLLGIVAAFIFAAQMFNFPVGPGMSGHLLGGVLAAVLLGRAGHRVAVLERYTTLYNLPRVGIVHDDVVRMFQEVGCLERVQPAMRFLPVYELARGRRILMSSPVAPVATHGWPEFISVYQPAFETELDRLRQRLVKALVDRRFTAEEGEVGGAGGARVFQRLDDRFDRHRARDLHRGQLAAGAEHAAVVAEVPELNLKAMTGPGRGDGSRRPPVLLGDVYPHCRWRS